VTSPKALLLLVGNGTSPGLRLLLLEKLVQLDHDMLPVSEFLQIRPGRPDSGHQQFSLVLVSNVYYLLNDVVGKLVLHKNVDAVRLVTQLLDEKCPLLIRRVTNHLLHHVASIFVLTVVEYLPLQVLYDPVLAISPPMLQDVLYDVVAVLILDQLLR